MEGDCCFICLSDDKHDSQLGPLGRHCGCKALFSHRSCLTRWQLQNAGKSEEKQCRFCKQPLGDWRTALAEVPTNVKRSPPIMAVVFQGKTVKVPVVTGPEGVAEFKRTVCKLFNLPEGTDFEVTFECKSPVFGDKLHLKGFDCFEAASYCAAVSAAKRATHKAAKQAAASGTSGNGAAASGSTSAPAAPSLSSSSPPPGAVAPQTTASSAPSQATPSLAAAEQQQPQEVQGQQQHHQAAAAASASSDAIASPSRLMRRLNETLLGDKTRRRAAPGADAPSNLRHASTADAATSTPLPGGASGASSAALTPLPSGASTPVGAGPHHRSLSKTHGGALGFMRRLRAGILCSSASSADAGAPPPLQPQLSGASTSASSDAAATSMPALAPLAMVSSAPIPPSPMHALQAASCQVPLAPSSSLPSAANLQGSNVPAEVLLQDPGSPAHSLSVAHSDNAPPAAHVATTTSGSGAMDEEAKPSGSALGGGLVSRLRRVF